MLDILNELTNESGKNAKIEILKNAKDDEILKRAFELAYSPLINFGIKKIPEYTCTGTIDLNEALNTIHQKFVLNGIRGNKAIDILQNTLCGLSEDDAVVLERIINRDLRIGCTGNTANKVWKNLIPTTPCMLASSQSDKSLANITYPAYAELKADGARCMTVIKDGEIKMSSRNGKSYSGLTKIENWLKQGHFDGFVLDGELVYITDEIQNRETGNGIVNKASKGTISDKEQRNIVYQVWDIIPYDVYYGISDEMNAPYTIRKKILTNTVNKLFFGETNRCIDVIPSTIVSSLEEAKKIYQRYVEDGFEGIILKNQDSLWEDKRSKNLVKFKEELLADMEIYDFIEGTGKHEGKLGSIMIRSDDGLVDCNCGIGDKDLNSLTDAIRQEIWDNREEYRYKIGEFKYNGLTRDRKTGVYSLFLPRYRFIRDDKDDANTLDHMQ